MLYNSCMADFLQPENVIKYLNLKSGMAVADFGAGSGFFTLPAAKIVGSSGKVTALDVQKDTLDFIKRRAKLENLTNIDTLWADIELAEGSRLPANSQDAVIISNVLFQAENKQAILREALRILKPEGKLLLLDWEENDPPPGPPRHLRVPERLAREYCEGMGYAMMESLPSGDHHYGFLFKK